MATSGSDVFGRHRSVVQTALLSWARQSLGFGAVQGSETGMVLSGHFEGLLGAQPMPLNVRVANLLLSFPY